MRSWGRPKKNVDPKNFFQMRNSYIGKVTKNCNFTPNSFCARREKLEGGGRSAPPPGHIGLKAKRNLYFLSHSMWKCNDRNLFVRSKYFLEFFLPYINYKKTARFWQTPWKARALCMQRICRRLRLCIIIRGSCVACMIKSRSLPYRTRQPARHYGCLDRVAHQHAW